MSVSVGVYTRMCVCLSHKRACGLIPNTGDIWVSAQKSKMNLKQKQNGIVAESANVYLKL